jgi:hypothetical protein
MESRLLMAADLTPPMLEQPAGELLIPDGELFLPGSISGRVFATHSADGAYQAGDEGIAGVRVELLNDDGQALAEALTDDAGRYDFPALAPGIYAVRETQPSAFDDGPEWFGAGGAWLEANDLMSEIVVMPGTDLDGYDFAERPAAVEEEVAPGEPVEEPLPNPTPMPIDEIGDSPLAGFVPLPTVEWGRAVNVVQQETGFDSVDVASTSFAPLTQRRGERIFGSGGQPIVKLNLDFDAALSEGYDMLAAFFEAFGAADQVAAGEGDAAPAVARDAAVAAKESRDAAREAAFEGDEQPPVADAPVTPSANPPSRRIDASHQLAGKPAA